MAPILQPAAIEGINQALVNDPTLGFEMQGELLISNFDEIKFFINPKTLKLEVAFCWRGTHVYSLLASVSFTLPFSLSVRGTTHVKISGG